MPENIMAEKKKKLTKLLHKVRTKLAPYISLTQRWCLYILISASQNRTYCGITVDFPRRFAQHISLYKGGARYTRMNGAISAQSQSLSWEPVCIISGFPEGKAIRQLEWYMHHPRRMKNFKAFRDVFLSQNPMESQDIRKSYGIHYRLFTLSYFILKYLFLKDIRLVWFHAEFRKDLMWKNHEISESFANMTVFEELISEYKARHKTKHEREV